MNTCITPEIEVEITLHASATDGRRGPILQGEYRGVLCINEEYFSVRFFVPMDDGFILGSTGKFGVQFLVPEAALASFMVGTIFTLWEGKNIGSGKVTKALQNVSQASPC